MHLMNYLLLAIWIDSNTFYLKKTRMNNFILIMPYNRITDYPADPNS